MGLDWAPWAAWTCWAEVPISVMYAVLKELFKVKYMVLRIRYQTSK